MNQPDETWAEQLRAVDAASEEESAEFVRALYASAQDDLDAQRAQAEYEREE